MHRILVTALALPLVLGAGAAMAEQATGTVDSVDMTTRTVVINGQPYIIEGQASGLKLDQIKVGDKVTVQFDVNTNDVSQIDHAK
jgi:Cu/Ag efflux protein CusF